MSEHGVPPHVRLANEIAIQFHHQSADRASIAIAEHMRTFWEPRMTSALLEYLDAGGNELDPVAVRAADRLRLGK
ncbi:formate dehydrogenase subunit delta [Kribbella sp. NBC_01245]|uniref:formate dehydrogenase subunit delta n=1 Tax=Kribbella sp. NBC_01245 TaxID=2903578 RepID=UPI002E2A2A61|nr:formate dehydrogenase subunit delta [Kribbella sp. NBC_01245]